MKRSEILNEACVCVCGHRVQDYGSPEDNFARIGRLWSAYLGIDISALDVAMMMCLFKAARIKTGTGTADSFIDLAGYAACGGEIATERSVTVGDVADDSLTDDERARLLRRLCCGLSNDGEERGG